MPLCQLHSLTLQMPICHGRDCTCSGLLYIKKRKCAILLANFGKKCSGNLNFQLRGGNGVLFIIEHVCNCINICSRRLCFFKYCYASNALHKIVCTKTSLNRLKNLCQQLLHRNSTFILRIHITI